MFKKSTRLSTPFEGGLIGAPFAAVKQNVGIQPKPGTVTHLTTINLSKGYQMPAVELHEGYGHAWDDQALATVHDLHDVGVPEGESYIDGMDEYKVMGRLSDGTDRDVTDVLIADGWRLWRDFEDLKSDYLELIAELPPDSFSAVVSADGFTVYGIGKSRGQALVKARTCIIEMHHIEMPIRVALRRPDHSSMGDITPTAYCLSCSEEFYSNVVESFKDAGKIRTLQIQNVIEQYL